MEFSPFSLGWFPERTPQESKGGRVFPGGTARFAGYSVTLATICPLGSARSIDDILVPFKLQFDDKEIHGFPAVSSSFATLLGVSQADWFPGKAVPTTPPA
ncbi:MAG: hypothetical protein ACKV0T_22245 [Planctomycetales bacterium]